MVNYVGHYEPQGSGDWRCQQCAMWFGGPGVSSQYVGEYGPYCPNCAEEVLADYEYENEGEDAEVIALIESGALKALCDQVEPGQQPDTADWVETLRSL